MTLPEPTIHYSETALEILRARYLRRDEQGQVIETPEAMFERGAPTGTISLIAGVSSSIEPYFALALSRRVLDGVIRTEVNPLVEAELTKLGALGLSAREFIEKHGSLRSRTQLPAELRRRFPSALEIAPGITSACRLLSRNMSMQPCLKPSICHPTRRRPRLKKLSCSPTIYS